MIKPIIVFVAALLVMENVESLHVDCKYKIGAVYYAHDEVYECSILNNRITSKEAIDSISGSHIYGWNNNNVAGIHADSKKLYYFPSGFENFFHNLMSIIVQKCELKEIHKEDLKPFPNLQRVDFYDNDIQVLEEDLFENNPKLVLVGFHYNNLIHVESNVFKKLANLRYLWLFQNPCIDMSAENNIHKVNDIRHALETKCKDQRYSNIKEQLEKIENNLSTSIFTNKILLVESDLVSSNYSSHKKFQIKLEELKLKKEYKEQQIVREIENIRQSVQEKRTKGDHFRAREIVRQSFQKVVELFAENHEEVIENIRRKYVMTLLDEQVIINED